MTQGLMYYAEMREVNATAIQDLFQMVADANVAFCIHEAKITQLTEDADAQAEMLDFKVSRFTGAFTEGTGGQDVIENATHTGGSTRKVNVTNNNDTTQMSGGTEDILVQDTVNVSLGFLYRPVPSARVWISPTDAFILRLNTTPDDAMTLRGYIIWEELGG